VSLGMLIYPQSRPGACKNFHLSAVNFCRHAFIMVDNNITPSETSRSTRTESRTKNIQVVHSRISREYERRGLMTGGALNVDKVTIKQQDKHINTPSARGGHSELP
jgi:hypothetical protein